MSGPTKTTKLHVGIIGIGYVGYPLACLLEEHDYTVTGVDTDLKRVKTIHESRLTSRKNTRYTGMKLTNTYKSIQNADIIVVCVPTPVNKDKTPNYKPLINAFTSIGRHMKSGQLIILESTVAPGICDEMLIPILERESGMKAGASFYFAHCPERINPGDNDWILANISRVVGAINQTSLSKAVIFYSSFLTANITTVHTLKEAEASKIIENCFRDVNIAFANELAILFSKLDINVVNVINAAATKPFGFLAHYPGIGVGGHCIPVDPYYLIEKARGFNVQHSMLSLAREINSSMPTYSIDLLLEELYKMKVPINTTTVAVLGLSYKPNINDDRESPSYQVINKLQELTPNVIVYDPYLLGKSTVPTLSAALEKADIVILATAHDEFTSLPPKDFKNYGVYLIVDGRNCLDKKALTRIGIRYRGIGT